MTTSIAVLAVTGAVSPAAAQPVDEARLQAAFVAKFPAFVQWPAGALEGRTVALCVYRSEASASYLRELVAGESVAGRNITVRTVASVRQLEGCHVLFVPARDDADLVSAVGDRPILTVGLEREFLEAGGIIALRRDSQRLRFEVDRDAADRAGLQLSSQLLRLALEVHGRQR